MTPTATLPETGGLWVYGYGSLMWNPGFAFEECRMARLNGFHRSLCVYSHVHRGTPERPGLVLGLDRGGSCHGHAFRVAADRADAVIGYLRAREQVTSVYLERRVSVRLAGGPAVTAITYVVDRAHAQYAGRLNHEAMLLHVRGAAGQSGPNPEYVLATHDHLAGLGLPDPTLEWLAVRLRAQGHGRQVKAFVSPPRQL